VLALLVLGFIHEQVLYYLGLFISSSTIKCCTDFGLFFSSIIESLCWGVCLLFSNPFVVLVLVGAGSFHWSPPLFIVLVGERLPNYVVFILVPPFEECSPCV
jgi:hypothetical protein